MCTCNDVTRSRGFGWRRRGFPPSGVPRGAPWELDARSPPRRQKDRAGGSLGPKSWERPADRLNKLRWALGRLPLGARRARVPMNGQVLSLPIRKYPLIRRISMKAALAATRLPRLFGTPRARESRAHLKSHKRVRMAKRRTTTGFLDASADQSALAGRRRHMRTMLRCSDHTRAAD